MHKLSIIIPVYNERRTIERILDRVEHALMPGWEREIIVVDDGSTDGTREFLGSRPTIKVILHEKNGGKGTAVRTGLAAAMGDFVLIQDADLEYDPEDIARLLAEVDAGRADVVYGSRNLRPREREGAYIPRMGVWGITKLINILHQLHLSDVWTCYKLFPRAAASDFRAGRFDSELLFTAALARRGYRFAEVPISYHPRDASEGKKIRYRDGFIAISRIIEDWIRHG